LRVSGLPEGDREEIRTLIQMRFLTKNPTKTLMLFEVPEESLKAYSQDNSKYGFVNLPDAKCRLVAQEFKGSEDMEREE